jgi:hypothetical protein
MMREEEVAAAERGTGGLPTRSGKRRVNLPVFFSRKLVAAVDFSFELLDEVL